MITGKLTDDDVYGVFIHGSFSAYDHCLCIAAFRSIYSAAAFVSCCGIPTSIHVYPSSSKMVSNVKVID
jgi:hypothetical protein